MSTPPEPDGPPAGGLSGSRMVRAVLVLAAFVLATVLLLGVVHPSPVSSASSAAAGSATGTTSAPSTTAPSTATTARHSSTSTVPPAHVSVLVANASGVTGAAASVSSELQPAGWNMLAPVNASAHVPTSAVYYLAGQQSSALAIANALHLPNTVVVPYTTAAPISSIGTAEVLVVVGPDLASRATSSTTTTATTTATTAARSATTTTHS